MSNIEHTAHVVVLSDKADKGIVYQGHVKAYLRDDESLAEATLNELRAQGYVVRHADTMFFPDAAPGNRYVPVKNVCR